MIEAQTGNLILETQCLWFEPRRIGQMLSPTFVKRDGSTPLTGDWDIGSGFVLTADDIRVRNSVGIGTDSPEQALHVYGGIIQITSNAENAYLFRGLTNGGASDSIGMAMHDDATTLSRYIWIAAAGNVWGGPAGKMVISSATNSGTAKDLWIYANDNLVPSAPNLCVQANTNYVGINTDNPTVALDVNGNVKAGGTITGTVTNAVTNAVTNVLFIAHESSGTPAANFGVGISTLLESSTTTNRDAGSLAWQWATATDASRAAKGKLTAYYTTTERDAVTWEANSTRAIVNVPGWLRVGGTTAPSVELDVSGAIQATSSITTTIGGSGGSFVIGTPAGASGFAMTNTKRADFRWDDSKVYILASTSTSAPSTSQGITIENGGNVGIKNASPADALDVTGNGRFSGTLRTALAVTWDLGGYTAGAPAATGYVTVKIAGTTYKLLTST